MRIENLIGDLETELIKSQNGLMSFPVLISRESGWMEKIPAKFKNICTEIDASLVSQLLDVTMEGYHAVIPEKKGTLNSALFSERLADWCLENHKDRLNLFEKSFVQGIELRQDRPAILTDHATILCNEVVLCTNGFENFYIHDKEGFAIDTKFHHLVQGVVGYMTGYLTDKEIAPMANKYFEKTLTDSSEGASDFEEGKYSDIYFYVTQRKFGDDSEHKHLLAIGGPEVSLVEREIYFKEFDVPESMKVESADFAKRHFSMDDFEDAFFWHGLMGYTRTGVRVVGPEPLDPRLMYNLGCNGVGILPSIMGAEKISRHVNGEFVEETIFDPKR
jgi:glycine/D-amino acid oxidase-like deaminating enzyme